MLVAEDNPLVHLSEHAGRFLVHPGGEVTLSVLRLVREELRIALQSLLQISREAKQPIDSSPIPVRFPEHSAPVVMRIRPSQHPDQNGFVLVIFEEQQALLQEKEETQPSAEEASASHAEQSLYRMSSDWRYMYRLDGNNVPTPPSRTRTGPTNTSFPKINRQ